MMSGKESTREEFTWSSPWPCSGNDRLVFLTISCRLSWMLSCSSSFSQSHVGPVGLLSWSLSLSAAKSCCFLTERRGSLLSALALRVNPGRIIGRRKNLRPASKPKILEKSLVDSQPHQIPCGESLQFPIYSKASPAINAMLTSGGLKTHIGSKRQQMGCTWPYCQLLISVP